MKALDASTGAEVWKTPRLEAMYDDPRTDWLDEGDRSLDIIHWMGEPYAAFAYTTPISGAATGQPDFNGSAVTFVPLAADPEPVTWQSNSPMMPLPIEANAGHDVRVIYKEGSIDGSFLVIDPTTGKTVDVPAGIDTHPQAIGDGWFAEGSLITSVTENFMVKAHDGAPLWEPADHLVPDMDPQYAFRYALAAYGEYAAVQWSQCYGCDGRVGQTLAVHDENGEIVASAKFPLPTEMPPRGYLLASPNEKWLVVGHQSSVAAVDLAGGRVTTFDPALRPIAITDTGEVFAVDPAGAPVSVDGSSGKVTWTGDGDARAPSTITDGVAVVSSAPTSTLGTGERTATAWAFATGQTSTTAFTWNICGGALGPCFDDAKEADPERGERAAQRKIDAVLARIREDSSTSVIMLQEVCSGLHAKRLQEELGDDWLVHYRPAKSMTNPSQFIECQIVEGRGGIPDHAGQTSAEPGTEPGLRQTAGVLIAMKGAAAGGLTGFDLDFSAPDGYEQTQGAACIRDDTTLVVACSSHFPNRDADNDLGGKHREYAAHDYAGQAKAWRNEGFRTVIGGDLNLGAGDDLIWDFDSDFFQADPSGRHTTGGFLTGNKYDYIFFDRAGWRQEAGGIVDIGDDLSDHRPVYGTVAPIDTLRLLQFNICGRAEQCPSLGSSDDGVVPEILDIIAEYHPDVVTLNEVCRGQFDALVPATAERDWPMRGEFVETVDYTPEPCTSFGNAVLTYGEIMEVSTPSGVLLPDLGKETEPRKVLCVRSQLTEGETEICVTHLSAGPEHADVRIAESEKVAEVINSVIDDGVPLILGGDFNATPHNQVLTPFYHDDAGGDGRLREVDSMPGCHPRLVSCRAGEHTTADAPSRKIDYLFVSDEFEVRYGDALDSKTSDHRQLRGLIKLK